MPAEFSLRALLDDLSLGFRQAKLRRVAEAVEAGDTVLDIGVWCSMPEPHPSENWLEKQALRTGVLIAVGLENMDRFHERYPEVLCVQADGCALPFQAQSIDVAVANAVLEHIAPARQILLVEGIIRVARGWAMITVPDRWCPLEIHSRLPLVHWLPFWREVFELLGQKYWASRENLGTLFTRSSLARLLSTASHDSGCWSIVHYRYLAFPVSLVAVYRKTEKG